MKSTEFIETKLNELYAQFNDIKIRYEIRANTNSHLIEIIPLCFFEENEEYIACETKIEEEFESIFPSENIVFISEDSLTEIINPDFKLGYDIIVFKNEVLNSHYTVEVFCENSDFQNINNYSLAA